MNEYDRAHIQDFLNGHGTWFTAHLFRLIAKADSVNRDRIRVAFPAEVAAFQRWQEQGRA